MMKTCTFSAAVLGLAMVAAPAQAIDVGPADYTILPGGTTIGMLYWQHLKSDRLTVNGTDVPGSEFEADVAILRTLSYFTLGDMPAVFHLVVPFASIGSASIGAAPHEVSEGIGDSTLGLTVWPVQPGNPQTGTTLGVSLFATLPTGGYDPARIGIGEGTFTITPQVGLIQGLGSGFYFDGVLDVALQADHTETGVSYKRDPSWQVQAMLRKQWGPATSLAIGYSGQRGGDQSVGGATTGLKTHRDQIRLYGSHFLNPTTQIQGMVGKDINVEGGFEYGSVMQLRLVKLF